MIHVVVTKRFTGLPLLIHIELESEVLCTDSTTLVRTDALFPG
jgi:hypothetical protein